MTREEFAARFKAARERAGLTQKDASDRLGVAQPRIAEYESGFRLPPVDRLVTIIEVLRLDPRTLFPEFWTDAKGRKR